jgi:F-type H+-transporting ATPase subunit b
MEKAAPLDAEAPIDTLPAIAPVNEATAPEHELKAAGHGHEGSVQLGAGHEGHGEAHGEGNGEHAGFSAKTFALQLFNFGVLLFILIWFGGRAMNKSLRARHEQLKGDINEAARLRDEAAQKFKVQDQRVADLEKEVAALRATLRQDAEREQARLLEGAQERAKRIQDEMQFQLNQQVKEAELLLRAEVASASVKLAEELLRKSLNTDDERRLAQEFVAGFAGVDGPVGPGGAVG